ncbi:glycoside hydrolase family 32 protein [Metabacillus sp. SLBN-84]
MSRYTEPKYRTIFEAKENELGQLKKKSADSGWKPAFHIHPQYGLINDPNGLAYFNGEFHVFYQWYPFGAMHGMKHWAHVKSADLINWERLPVAIVPVEDYESHGAYSGASLEVDGRLYLYYTGNIKYGPEERSANQCLAVMEKDGSIHKYEHNPIIKGVPEGYTGHVRDPKVFKRGNKFYMLLGAQRSDQTGAVIVYDSDNAVDWSFKGELTIEADLPETVYMLECPDYFELDGRDVLIVSPQGLKADGHDYQNLYNVMYMIGHLDLEALTFKVTHYQEVEKGFDFYAPQTFEGKNGERLLLAWAGMGEMDYPSDRESWAHCLTIPRELSIENVKLIQQPAEAVEQLRRNTVSDCFTLDRDSREIENESVQYELEMEFSEMHGEHIRLELFSSETEGLVLTIDRTSQTVSLNREKFNESFGGDYGFIRSAELGAADVVKARIFADRSIVEIFLNDGETVFTSRVFPDSQSNGIRVFSDGSLTVTYAKHELLRGISI